MKDISNITKDFENFPYKDYVWKRPKHKPTGSYFYLSIHIYNCMMRADALNLYMRYYVTSIQSNDCFYFN